MNLKTTCFERAIFFSWGCKIKDCAYCYMSTQPELRKKDGKQNKQLPRRSTESILAEAILCKKLGWQIGFFSGGIGAYKTEEFLEVLKDLFAVIGEKIWLNIGALSQEELQLFKPYAKGVVASIETVNPEIHDKVCPSKPIAPYLEMFEYAKEIGLKRAITIIIGLGETIDDFDKLKEMIETYGVEKIHIYGLNPHKGTSFENTEPPSSEYQAEWIKKTRDAFPDIDIQFGIWIDRVGRVSELLKAGANSISKFPAIRLFGSEKAKEIEKQARLAGRKFQGTLTMLPDVNWNAEVDSLKLDADFKERIKQKLNSYLRKMKKA
ncbi:MAG: radical SAM protein [Nanoarchaeota archaeon]|nr:radical SAM protein [Nanoarchaeota archaeon]MBU1322274.1 radical SAM protein [Nanoarchaeota archaeon]MBU1598027.1 radical SAM protein [Nanoarchaeota archaeon]MBU2441007.1 radical SAM protein [Nanoarchaeota archaeon]